MPKGTAADRDFIKAPTLIAVLKNAGCQQLPKWSKGMTFWRAPSGVVFTLTDPHQVDAAGTALYDRGFLLDFRDRLIVILRGAMPDQDGSKRVFQAERS